MLTIARKAKFKPRWWAQPHYPEKTKRHDSNHKLSVLSLHQTITILPNFWLSCYFWGWWQWDKDFSYRFLLLWEKWLSTKLPWKDDSSLFEMDIIKFDPYRVCSPRCHLHMLIDCDLYANPPLVSFYVIGVWFRHWMHKYYDLNLNL